MAAAMASTAGERMSPRSSRRRDSGSGGKPCIGHLVNELGIKAGESSLLIFRRQGFCNGENFIQPDGFTIQRGNRYTVLTKGRGSKEKKAGGKGCQKLSHEMSSR